MKYFRFLLVFQLIGIFISGLNAQISILSENAQGIFMIDGAGDDPSSGVLSTTQSANNVFVDTDGHMGIGMFPNATDNSRLQINGSIMLRDGTQAEDRLLMSDANGKASWQSIGLSYVNGYLHPTGLATGLYPNSSSTEYWTGSYIDLPPGTYAVSLMTMMTTASGAAWNGTQSFWARMSLSDSSTGGTYSADIQGSSILYSGNLHVNAIYGFVKGMLIVKNQSTATKRYYLITWYGYGHSTIPTTLKYYGSGYYPENKFYALRISD